MLRKNANIQGKRGKNRQKVKNIHCTYRKKYYFERGGGQKYCIFENLYTVPLGCWEEYQVERGDGEVNFGKENQIFKKWGWGKIS